MRPLPAALTCTVLLASLLPADEGTPKKVALLVGVNQYLKPGFKPLQFAEADVIAVGDELKKLGFGVTVLLGSGKGEQQATQANIDAAARKMVAPLGQGDVALVMLSGHGQQLSADQNDPGLDKSQSYYCPVDAVVNHPETQVALSHLLDDILAPNVGRKMLLVDACRDIPVDRTRGRNTKGIEGRIVALPEGTAVFFSCSAGQTSFERDELGHGLFTFCVLEGLRGGAIDDGEIAWSGLVAHVSKRMTQADLTRYMPAKMQQVPIPAGALAYTVLGRSTPVAEAQLAHRAPVSIAAVPAAPATTDSVLQQELRDLEVALLHGTTTAKQYFEPLAKRRYTDWRQLANTGDPIAQYFVGRCQQYGLGVERNSTAATVLFRQAGEGKVGLAWNALGAAYQTGLGVERDPATAADCYRKAAAAGCAAAMLNLGQLYLDGDGVPKSPTQSFDWYKQAAESGDARGMCWVANQYFEGVGTHRDFTMARTWYERAIAQGYTGAMNDLAYMYHYGHGVPLDYSEAMRLYRMGAEAGNPFCMENVGLLFHNGQGVDKNHSTALQWYRRAWKAVPNAESPREREKVRNSILFRCRELNASPE